MKRFPTGKTSRRGHPHILMFPVNSFINFFSIDKPPPTECIFFCQIEAYVTVLGIVLPFLQGQDSCIFISYEKKWCIRFVFSSSAEKASGMHCSSLQFLFKPFTLTNTQKISNISLFNHSMHFTVSSGF